MSSRVTVRLTPRAGRDAIDGWDGDVLRARVAAAPSDGAANAALLRLLAKALRVAPTTLTIASGARSRNKTIEIGQLTVEQVRARTGG